MRDSVSEVAAFAAGVRPRPLSEVVALRAS
jgi:hypothetical protein